MLVGAVGVAALAVGVGFSVFTQAGPTNDESARLAIAALFAQRHDALVHRDLEAYMRTVDPARVVLRGCEQQEFEAEARLGLPPENVALGRVDKWGDYLRVWLDTDTGLKRVFARDDGARWYLSEPTSAELGEDVTREYDGVKIHFRAVEEDFAAVIGEDLPSIIDTVLDHAVARPAQLFELRISTLTTGSDRCFVAGQAESGRGATLITLRDVRLTPAYNHLTRDTSATIEHEALHWLQNDHSARAMRTMDWWLIEGWPFLISDFPSTAARRFAVCAAPPTYEDLRLGPAPGARLEDATRAYIAASLLVERLSRGTGDREYWRVVDSFALTDLDDPFAAAVGLDPQSFYTTWLSDARVRYC